jgi:dTDP-N-acetylfucosamine:lipid II N-acetylfucosaminyltransferase
MKILHFAPDDKFVPFVQRTFDTVFPGRNEYRIPVDTAQQPLRFVLPGAGVQAVTRRYWRSQQIAADLASTDCLVINFMTPLFASAVAKAPPRVLVVWVGWGNDYYKFIEPFLGDFHLPQTAELVSRLKTPPPPVHRRLLQLARRGIESPEQVLPYLVNRNGPAAGKDRAIVNRIIHRIDYVSVLEEEKPLFEKAFPAFHKNYHRIQLYSAEEVFSVGPERMCGPDILVGNSATPTNNHLELFDALAALDLTGRRLVTPLNYGNESYGQEIARIGRGRFGDAFVPLLHFLPLDEYYHRIGNCGTVLMNHVRQQAGTTVATALYKGAKVFLRNENPLLSFYRKLGMTVRSIQDDCGEATRPFEAPPAADRASNRQILESHWGHEAALASIVALEELVARKRAAGDARSTVQDTP